MKPVVYIDVVFGINLVVSGTILYLCIRFMGEKPVWWRILLSSLLGTAYALLQFVPALSVLYSLPAKLVLSMLMVLCAVRIRSVRELLHAVVLFYITSFLFGGCVWAVFSLVGQAGLQQALAGQLAITVSFPYGAFVLALAVGALLLRYFAAWLGRRRRQSACRLRAEVVCGGKAALLPLLADTGCNLRDPVSGLPVLITETSALRGILPRALLEACAVFEQSGRVDDWSAWSDYQVRLVPFEALGRRDGVLPCIRPQGVTVCGGGKVLPLDCLLGLYAGTLAGDGYRALIGYDEVYKEEGEGDYASAL